MGTLNFQSAFALYKIRTEGEWTLSIPAISITCQKSANDLNGTYEITYPNPKGFALNRFTNFDEQEIWLKDAETAMMRRVFVGQINALDYSSQKNTLKIKGRGLNGLLTDRKVNTAWEAKLIDYIICDPTYGIIPSAFGSSVTTWNGFTDDFDRFDFWSEARWGVQPAYCTVYAEESELEFQGDAGETRTVTGVDEYLYEVAEFRMKTSAASATVRFGFRDSTDGNYVRFELTAAGVNCETYNGTETSTAVGSPPTQTAYNYYRIEWANGEARFFVNGLLVATNSTHVPATHLKLFMQADQTASLLTFDYMKAIILTREMEEYVVKNKMMRDVIQELCDIGTESDIFTFYVSDDYDFTAKIADSSSSGYSFGFRSSVYTSASQQIKTIEPNYEARDLFNKVIIEGGQKLTTVSAPSWTDQTKGDGTTAEFILGYKAKNPLTAVEVNSVAKTEGTHFTVTYGREHSVVKFLAGSVPANTHTINFRYDYYSPVIATATDDDSIAGYGVTREYVKHDDTITVQSRAQRLADALLSFYSDERAVITVSIPILPALGVGQTVNIDAPDVGIDNDVYEIIELAHTIAPGARETKMTLANSELNPNAEIIREILQQVKDLRTKGDTNQTTVNEKILKEYLDFVEALYREKYLICDSLILGHAVNGRLGRGEQLDEMEVTPPTWGATGASVARSSAQARVGTYSMSVTPSEVAVVLTDTTSYGDMSAYLADSSGVIGIWVYVSATTDITAMTLRIGSSASDYSEISGKVYSQSGITFLVAGWNYVIFKLSTGAITGTPAWNALDYSRLSITVAAGLPVFYLDYYTCGDGDEIASNGLEERIMYVANDEL